MITLEIVPMKLLRSFCVKQKYGIHHVSTRTKDDLIAALREVDPEAENKLPAWLAVNAPGYKVEALPSGGRRLTQDYGNGTKRVYEEDANGFTVKYETSLPPQYELVRSISSDEIKQALGLAENVDLVVDDVASNGTVSLMRLVEVRAIQKRRLS